jgi:dynein intermediate chain
LFYQKKTYFVQLLSALFASVDGNGRLDLWNLNNDTEVATASVYVGASQSGKKNNNIWGTKSGSVFGIL